jgi:peptidoglycan/xylan/chitin deacetylase (PgdA/CDA1 family)
MGALTSSLLRWTATGLHAAHLSAPLSKAAGYASAAPTFPILSYHRVNDEGDPFFPSLSTEVFERQMAFVARAYVVLTVEELAERMRRRAVPRNALAITFDDGYRDNLTHAAPILARHGLPATVFRVTGAIAPGEPLWFDRLALAFKYTRTGAWSAPWGETVALGSESQRLAALAQTTNRFKRLANDERRRSVEQALETLGVGDERPLKNLMLSWDDVQAVVGLGVTIGAHTVSHPILSRLGTEEARAEIRESGRMIEAACGRHPGAFAYPNGRPEDFGPAVAALVREAGFSCAVTTTFGVNTVTTPPYELRRGGPWESHLPTFALKLAGYRLIEA